MRGQGGLSERERPTLRDVADRVGVSVNTASFVLNGSRSGTRVSPKTRDALLSAAVELGYRPNEVARSLQRQRTRLIGLFAQFEHLSAGNAFLSELVGGIQEACAELRHDLVLHTIPRDCRTEMLVPSLADYRIDGLLVFVPEGRELAEALANTHLPAVSLAEPGGSLASVTVDNAKGGELQAEHLWERGHRRVIYRTWHADIPSARTREAAFRGVASRLGMEVVMGRTMWPMDSGDLTDAERAVLAPPFPATAFACWSDDSAQATCATLHRAGLRIPDDVAVVGFDGAAMRYEPRWRLTTIRAPWREVGATALRRLYRLIEGDDVIGVERLPVSLVQGATT
ncbi:LacI family DNA-binding transcriptional regulator [soil metagenome]